MTVASTDAELREIILNTLYRWLDWPKGHPDREITRAFGCSGDEARRVLRVCREFEALGLVEGQPLIRGGVWSEYYCGLTPKGIDVAEGEPFRKRESRSRGRTSKLNDQRDTEPFIMKVKIFSVPAVEGFRAIRAGDETRRVSVNEKLEREIQAFLVANPKVELKHRQFASVAIVPKTTSWNTTNSDIDWEIEKSVLIIYEAGVEQDLRTGSRWS